MAADVKAGNMIVHFGIQKTGSTSIQISLFRHLADSRFYYVNFGSANANFSIATGFKDDPGAFHTHARRGTSSDELRRLRNEAVGSLETQLRSTGDKTAILSSEAISGLRMPELHGLHDVLARHRQGVTAVGYVRRPKEYAESAFQQRIKAGGFFNLSRLFPRFPAMFKKLDAVLGQGNVRIWLFDPASFPGHCVVQDFCSRLGIRFQPADVVRANEGVSLPALSLLFAYRKYGPGYGVGPTVIRENKMLVKKVSTLRGPKLRLHSSLVAPVIEQRRRDIVWMEERLGVSLAEDLTAHDEGAIRSEEDLLRFGPEALEWLAGELGGDYLRRWHPRMTPQEVAEWMHRLRLKLANGDEKIQNGMAVAPQVTAHRMNLGDSVMNIEELVESAKRSAPTLKSIADEDAQSLLRTVFKRIREEVEKTGEGKVKVNGLGQFRIRAGEREKDGHKTQVKRIVFQASKSRGKDKDKDEDEDE